MDYDDIAKVLTRLSSRFGWDPIMEGDLIIGVQKERQTVTLEPGGQFELSGAPLATLHQTCAEVNSHLYQVRGAINKEIYYIYYYYKWMYRYNRLSVENNNNILVDSYIYLLLLFFLFSLLIIYYLFIICYI